MATKPHFNQSWLTKLLSNPSEILHGVLNGHQYNARLIIPNYKKKIIEFYSDIMGMDLSLYCQKVEIPFDFDHFGVSIEFDQPTELILHTSDMVIDEGLRQIMAITGPIIIKNAYIEAVHREPGHKNRFPHLNFHIDRNSKQGTVYSMYTRNPFDPEQKLPRTSSTLFVANIVGYLQGVRDGIVDNLVTKGRWNSYELFKSNPIEDALDKVVANHPWDEPLGTGEISMLDNRTVLHASYYRDAANKGYKIGVRYVA